MKKFSAKNIFWYSTSSPESAVGSRRNFQEIDHWSTRPKCRIKGTLNCQYCTQNLNFGTHNLYLHAHFTILRRNGSSGVNFLKLVLGAQLFDCFFWQIIWAPKTFSDAQLLHQKKQLKSWAPGAIVERKFQEIDSCFQPHCVWVSQGKALGM